MIRRIAINMIRSIYIVAYRYIPLIFLFYVPGSVYAANQQQWDPPSIKVFPDHDKAALTQQSLDSFINSGRVLFVTKFNAVDGAGRPNATGDSNPTARTASHNPGFIRTAGPDANSCAGCHNQPKPGGSGEFAANVFVGAQLTDPPTLSISPQITNERNTISIFGSGAIEMIAREMTRDLQLQRNSGIKLASVLARDYKISLQSKGVKFGTITARKDGSIDTTYLEGVDDDLVVKPFGIKGTSISLREFTIGALNQHHGIQAVERFGKKRTGQRDFDNDGINDEFKIGQLSALVMFQASLPAPERNFAQDFKTREIQLRGEALFSDIGCASCHAPRLFVESTEFSEPNPYNRNGTIRPEDVGGIIRMPLKGGDKGSGLELSTNNGMYVVAYSDFRRHKICDKKTTFFCNEKVKQNNIPIDEFMTPKLWDLATSAPYGHRGDCSTLSEVIMYHGAEGANARMRFENLADDDKRAVIAFLLSLGAGDSI